MSYFLIYNFILLFIYTQAIIKQVHISQGKTSSSVIISWSSNKVGYTTKVIIKYGLKNFFLNNSEIGYSSSYNFTWPYHNVYSSGILNHVTITNLLSDTVYYYQCINVYTNDYNLTDVSDILSFRTNQYIGSIFPQIFTIVGDLGQTIDSQYTIDHMSKQNNSNIILHVGDLSYADCNQTLWDSYGELIEPISSKKMWMVAPGNHEIEFTNAQEPYRAFEERYKMPHIKPAEYGPITIPPKLADDDYHLPYCCSSVYQSGYDYGNSFYYFETGMSHIIFLNAYTYTNLESNQYKWLESNLQSVNRKVTPWIIVVIHCPWYSSNMDHYGEKQTVEMRNYMEPLFYKYNVNIVFSGHVHAYERSHPVYLNNTNLKAPIYITIGDGGNLEGHAKKYYEQPSWSAYRNGTNYGYGTLEIINLNKAQWKWYRNQDKQFIAKDVITFCNSYYSNVYC
jgi:hypothetical protein